MNIQEADKNPADKEAEKKGKCQLMGLKRRRKRIKGIIGRTHGQGIPWGGAGGVFISKGHGSVALLTGSGGHVLPTAHPPTWAWTLLTRSEADFLWFAC